MASSLVPLVGVGVGRTNPREFLDALIPSPLERELQAIADRWRYHRPVERAPLTGAPPLVDLPALLRKHAAAGRFAGPERAAPRAGDGSRMDAIAALAASVVENAYETTRPTALAARPEAVRSALVQTRTELPPVDKSLDIRDLRHMVKNRLRRLHQLKSNARKCGRVRFRDHVEARVKTTDGVERGMVNGIIRCASVWSCPTCAPAISNERAEQVRAIVKAHRAEVANEAVYMLTLTVPHELSMRLRALRTSVSEAWQLMQRGAPWKRLRARMGFVGSITSREVTVGPNGWHPHLHILIATSRVWTDAERHQFEVDLFIRWANALARVDGLQVECPSWEHGISLVPCHDESYIQKLGLADEMVGALYKQARGANRTPFEVMADYYRGGSKRDEKILRAYVRGIKGARQLTWSRGKQGALDLRQRYAEALRALDPDAVDQHSLGMETDAELIAKADQRGTVVAEIPGRTWDALVRVMKRAGADAEFWIATAAEYAGAHGVEAAIGRAYVVGAELAKKDTRLKRWLTWLQPREGIAAADVAAALLTRRAALAR